MNKKYRFIAMLDHKVIFLDKQKVFDPMISQHTTSVRNTTLDETPFWESQSSARCLVV